MGMYTQWQDLNNNSNQPVKFSIGDTIRVHQKIVEGDGKDQKQRNQIFEGMVIAIKGQGDNKSITVRKIGANLIGVERIWPLKSPAISNIEVKTPGKVRRAKLYYTREQTRKQLRKIKQHA